MTDPFHNFAPIGPQNLVTEMNSGLMSLTSSASAQSMQFDAAGSDRELSIYNSSTNPVWMRFQPTSTTTPQAAVWPTAAAPSPGFPIPASAVRNVKIPDGVVSLCGIALSAPSSVYVSPGRGGTTP